MCPELEFDQKLTNSMLVVVVKAMLTNHQHVNYKCPSEVLQRLKQELIMILIRLPNDKRVCRPVTAVAHLGIASWLQI